MFLIVIDYASIVLFFVLLAALLLAVTRQKPATSGEKAPLETGMQSTSLSSKITYGLLAALFVLLLAGAWFSERKISRAHSSK